MLTDTDPDWLQDISKLQDSTKQPEMATCYKDDLVTLIGQTYQEMLKCTKRWNLSQHENGKTEC